MKRSAVPRAWLVLVAVSVGLLFGSGTTFPSLGIPLFAMAGQFHWSQAAAGSAFLTLGVVVSATSLAPMVLIPRIGARWTMTGGMLLLACGFLLASATQSLWGLYAATAVFGFAFALVANASGTYLVASWFQDRAPSVLGLYIMVGNLGGAVIPPLAGVLVVSSGGWRFYWQAMAAVAVVMGGLCALLIREPPAPAEFETGGEQGWGYRTFLPTPQFMIVAAGMVAIQACTNVVGAVATPHLVQLGWPQTLAPQILGLQGLVGALATGAAGWLTERFDPRKVMAAALTAEAVGLAMFAFAHKLWLVYAFTPVFGAGWSVSTLAGIVILIRYFGRRSGTAAQSTVWTLAGVATAGPSLAGLVADRTGGFAPSLLALAALLLPLAAASLTMKPLHVSGLEERPSR